MKAKKSLGQNFLIDNNIINKIVSEVSATSDDLIIEIGPGRGALTNKLKLKQCNVICYELDRDLEVFLSKIEDDKVKIIYKDFLKTDIKEDIKDISYNNLYLVGNLPYYITTPIIEHVINENLDFKKFTIMVQKEVAERFMAKPKSKDYGYITLVLKYFFDISKVCDVSHNSFNPAPKVESMVISLEKRENIPSIDIEKYFAFLKDAFKQKRKTLKNNLKEYDYQKIRDVLTNHGLEDNVRAEELDEDILIEIFNKLT